MCAMRRALPTDSHADPTCREQLSCPVQRGGEFDFTDRPVMGLIWAISANLAELLGPMLWAALIVLYGSLISRLVR
jgi:hypothetical protein